MDAEPGLDLREANSSRATYSLRVEFVAATLTNNNSSPSASSSPVVLTFLSAPQTCACPASCDESNLAHRWLGFFAALLERVAWLRARFSADTYSSFVPRAFGDTMSSVSEELETWWWISCATTTRTSRRPCSSHELCTSMISSIGLQKVDHRHVHGGARVFRDGENHLRRVVNPLKSSEISREAAGRRSWRAYQDDRQVSATDFCISSP
ncbi:hypothetical protein PF005_g24147 [Phytophthora fragariae]|uniref:Uncharacterized protein n=1 Tax=Phytophthora fragariae TaxID=53985 RepID=A0A6A3W336_9STRA|nr:hypothetical protein PF009_g25066 [Phytophthora fragariae]KAE9178270.1 hypothetical protein PF005_g24147 [Phytophthora fragariae]KAE9186880.1 hypothetical protein PF004_g22959 [Phytophthora fragariae]